jgi:hypothetical protein
MGTKETNKLSLNELLAIIEEVPIEKLMTESLQEQLKKAADLLFSDYNSDKELTVFSSTDF